MPALFVRLQTKKAYLEQLTVEKENTFSVCMCIHECFLLIWLNGTWIAYSLRGLGHYSYGGTHGTETVAESLTT